MHLTRDMEWQFYLCFNKTASSESRLQKKARMDDGGPLEVNAIILVREAGDLEQVAAMEG